MFSELNNYINNGHFLFERGKTLSKVCNAPEQAAPATVLPATQLSLLPVFKFYFASIAGFSQ